MFCVALPWTVYCCDGMYCVLLHRTVLVCIACCCGVLSCCIVMYGVV